MLGVMQPAYEALCADPSSIAVSRIPHFLIHEEVIYRERFLIYYESLKVVCVVGYVVGPIYILNKCLGRGWGG